MALTRKSMSLPLAEQPSVHRAAPDDVLRQMLTTIVQQTLQEEFTRFLGAAPHERTSARRGWRNGHRQRHFTTRVGSLELRVPRDRAGLFQPALFARYERSEQAFLAALVEMYVQGVSTRKVTRVVETLCGVSVSASAVSAVVKKLDAEVTAWRTRDLESWTMVFEDLVRRGLRGVRYAVSDEHQGLVLALRRFFPEAAHQRCQVHYLRNALSRVSARGAQEQLLAALRDVWAAPSRVAAEGRLAQLVAAVRKRVPPLASWLEETGPATLEFFALAAPIQRRLASTNSIELDHAELRRRTRVIRIFPNEASLLRLGTALAMERNEVWSVRRYFNPKETILAVTQGRLRLRRSA